MKVRTILAAVLLLVGNSFIIWNGQVFSQALISIGFCLVGLFLCLPNLRDWPKLLLGWRIVTCILLVLSFGLGAIHILNLPASYKYQNEFNLRRQG